MQVSSDELQLPEAVADTARELSELVGTSESCIISCVSKFKHGKLKSCKYIKVELEEDEE